MFITGSVEKKFRGCSLQHISTKISLLYVEDEPGNRLGMSSLLSAVFPAIELHIAGNGAEAQKLFQKYCPDIILTDITLPDMDGTQMAAEFRVLSSETVLIFLSGRDYKEYPHLTTEAGFTHLLTKPVDCAELIEIIKKCSALVARRKHHYVEKDAGLSDQPGVFTLMAT